MRIWKLTDKVMTEIYRNFVTEDGCVWEVFLIWKLIEIFRDAWCLGLMEYLEQQISISNNKEFK